ncbi:MAG: fibronectin type III domain-containing protein, partial [Mycobacteriales bacterium]
VDMRIAEYAGVDPVNALDVAVASGGTGSTSTTGAVTTTNANDLLVAGNFVSSSTGAPGSGFTSRLITNPDGDILEDRIVTATGSYTATATLSPSGNYAMQMAAFRAAGGGGSGDTQPPTAPSSLSATALSSSQINLSWTASTDNVGVTGYRIERCQGTGCSSFTQIGTTTATTYSSGGLVASTSYSYRVRATDGAGNLSPYSNTATATTQQATTGGGGTLAYVQGGEAIPQTPQTSVSVTLNAQAAGDFNLVVIGWNNATSSVLSVTDSAGNSYALTGGPTTDPQAGSQAIYYAANIAASASNRVIVTFDSPVPYPDLRVVEYSGVDPTNPIDS